MNDEEPGRRKLPKISIDKRKIVRHAKKVETATQRHAHRFIIRRIENVRLVSREIITWLVLVGIMIAGMGLQLLWNQSGYMVDARQPGGLYVEGVIGPLDTLNPLYVSTSASESVSRLIFSSLYDYDTTGSLRQDISSAMQIDPTGKIYTVTLRDDVMWHDGERLTAKDVVFTIDAIKNPMVRSPLRINWTDVDVRAASDTSVVFTLPATYAAFPHALTFPILPQHLLKDVAPAALRESAYSAEPVGSGPFVFRRLQSTDSISRHQVVHMTANDSYYRGIPKLSRLELHVFDSETSLVTAINAREVSGASGVSPTSVAGLAKSHQVTPVALSSGVYAILNMNNATLKDAAVRQALQVGTDTASLRAQLGGGVRALDLPVLPTQLSGSDIPHAPAFDITRAGAILDGAGWKLNGSVREKDGRALTLVLTTTKDGEYDKVARLLKDQWTKLGIDVQLRVVDATSASSVFIQDTLQARNFDILLYELELGADPDVYAYWHSSQIGQAGYNFASYANSAADASLASARSRLEPELRNAKYKAFAQQWLTDVPAIALYQSVVEYVTNKNVDAVDSSANLVTDADRYSNILYWTVAHDSVYKTP